MSDNPGTSSAQPDTASATQGASRTPLRSAWMSVSEATDALTRERDPEAGTTADAKEDKAPPEEARDTSHDIAEPEGQPQAEPPSQTPAEGTDDEDPEIEVEVGDKPERVRFSELRKGYLRQADYTRKTMALANQQREFQQHYDAVQKEREQYSVVLNALQKQVTSGVVQRTPQEWAQLKATDPVGFMMEERDYEKRIQQLNDIASEQARLAQVAQQEQQNRMVQAREAAREFLIKSVPEWSRADVAQRETQALTEFAQSTYGLTDQQLNAMAVAEPRLVLVMRDAMRAAQGQGKSTVAAKRVAPSAVRQLARTRTVPQTDQNASRRNQANAAFKQTPSLKNAVEALMAERGE